MLLPAIVKTVLFYGGLAVAGFALLIFSVMRDEKRAKEAQAGNLPEATIAGRAKDGPWPWLRWVLLVAGGVLAGLMYFKTTDVVLVTDDGEYVSAERKVRLFGSNDYALAPNHKPSDFTDDPTWVVNKSSHAVRVVHVQYGRSLGFGNQPTLIPSGTAAQFSAVEHIGPDDQPPNEVRDQYKLGMDSRNWLTW